MNIHEISKWQWDGYSRFHQSQINLLLHIVAVPVFWYGFGLLIYTLPTFDAELVAVSLALMITSMGAQGFGHGKEKTPTEPFTGAKNALIRIFLEQLYTFPKFVLTGIWYKNLNDKKPS